MAGRNRKDSQGKMARRDISKKSVSSSTPHPDSAEEPNPSGTAALPDMIANAVSATGESKSRSASNATETSVAQIKRNNEGEASSGSRRKSTVAWDPLAVTVPDPDVFQFLEGAGSDAVTPLNQSTRSSTGASVADHKSRRESGRRKSNSSQALRFDYVASPRDHSPGRTSSVGSRDSTEFQPATPPDLNISPFTWRYTDGSLRPSQFRMAGTYVSDTEGPPDSPVSSSPGGLFGLSTPESFYLPKWPGSTRRKRPVTIAANNPDQANDDIKSPAKSTAAAETSKLKPKVVSYNEIPCTTAGARVYRKFEALNYKVLRHIQDDITRMEQDLSQLEELEVSQRQGSQFLHKAQVNDYETLRFQKFDLMEKLLMRTDQYNRALCSFNKLIQTLPTATEADAKAYRTWTQKRSHLGKAGTTSPTTSVPASDLVILSPRPVPKHTAPSPVYCTVATISAAVLVPLLTFGVISEFFGRILIVASVAGATALFASNGPAGNEYLIDPHDGLKCAALYFTFMSLAALLIR